MKELTRLNFTDENNPPSFEATSRFIDSLKELHNVKEIFIWPGVDRQIDFSKFDPENITETPYKENNYISLRIKA